MEEEKEMTLSELLDQIQNNDEEEETQVNPRLEINEEREGNEIDDNLNINSIKIESNTDKNTRIPNYFTTKESFITESETKENTTTFKLIFYFLYSVVNMLNDIIEENKYNEKLYYPNISFLLKSMSLYEIKLRTILEIITLNCQHNMDIIFHVLDIENKNKKAVFETLINLRFIELYKKFKSNCPVITRGSNVYILVKVFRTLSYFTATDKKFEENVGQFINLDEMEIETISLDNDFN